MLGIIRVLTTSDEGVLLEHGDRLKENFGFSTKTRCIPSQPNGIYDEQSEKIAIPKIVALAKKMAREVEIDALTISCAADPALEEARDAVNVPVLGAGICGAHAACMVGSNVAVIGITDQVPMGIKNELGDKFFSYSFATTLRKTTDLFQADAKEKLLHIAEEAIKAGADVILFACTGFSTIRLKDYLINYLNVPVIDLVDAQGIAYQLIERKVNYEKQNI